jgi:clan AA aspartic protease (TIGR02281 family)
MWPLEIPALIDWGTAIVAGFLAGTALSSPQQHPVSNEPHPPIYGEQPAGRQLLIDADSNNQCYVEAFANGRKFRFLADTGASSVFFTMADARKLGLDSASLSYDHSYSQWGGTVKGATFTLREFRVNGFVLHDVEAVIDRTDYDTPLLGAPVLKAMNFQLRDGSCIFSLPSGAAAVRSASVEPPPYKPSERKPEALASAAVEPQRAANGEPLDGVCQVFVRNRQVNEQYAHFADKCEKRGHY